MKRTLLVLCLGMIGLLVACGGEETAVPTQNELLTGDLTYILQEPRRQALMRVDVETGAETLLFEVPVNAWLSHMAASPDGSQIAMTYAPSPGENEIQYGYSSLYLLLADGRSEPRLLVERTAEQEVFFNPAWSPDGAWLYYSHVTPLDEDAFSFITYLERLELATGNIEVLAENGIWPRVSEDGRFLAYVNIDQESLAAEMILANADGSNPTVLVPRSQFVTLDSPFFSADGAWLYFSAVAEQTGSASWWEVLLGINVAAAHNLPSRWWRLPVAGGEPEPVTTEARVGQFGTLSSDGQRIAFTTQDGLYIMQPDGSDEQRIVPKSTSDSLSWTP